VDGASTAPLAAGENLRGSLEFHRTLAGSHPGPTHEISPPSAWP